MRQGIECDKKIKISGYRIYKQLILEPNPKLNLIVGGMRLENQP
jgi:hypothetical protein